MELITKEVMKRFREYYGIPPQEFIMRKRIRKAKYTLLNTDLSIDAISESLGFCNTSHFIRRFSEATGFSPAKFRKKQN
jgi:AraC-like DNA-binding protein